MWVTCYTDASMDPATKKTSYAYWVKSEKGRITFNECCPLWVKDINLAELYAAKKAVEAAHQKWNSATHFLVQILKQQFITFGIGQKFILTKR